jgi:hypothetical protein
MMFKEVGEAEAEHWEATFGKNPNNKMIEVRTWFEMFSDTTGPFDGWLAGHAFTEYRMLHIYWT